MGMHMKMLFKVVVNDSKVAWGSGIIDTLLVVAKDAADACQRAEKHARSEGWSQHHISSVELVAGTVIT